MTSDLDTVKINDGFQALITPGQVEWSIINPYETNLNGHRLQIDEREFFGTGINLNQIKYIKLFDVYEGPIQPLDFNGWWKQWIIPGNIDLVNKVAASSFQSSLRLQNGWYGIRAEYTFSPIRISKPHGIRLTTINNITSLYDNIITVSDVFLAFKEVSNNGLFGNESGLEFGNGIQFMNADVDENGVFNEMDTYKLLQHLTGVETINNGSSNLSDYIKLYTKSEYDGITKTNWSTKSNTTRNLLPFTLSNTVLNNIYNVSITWKGDINLSHSAQSTQSSNRTNSVLNEITTSLMGEMIEGKVVITLTLDPLQQEVVGTQFQVNYDNTKLKFEKSEFITKNNPTNFTINRGSSITIGSLITDGSTILDKTTEYKLIFNPINPLTDILGLTSVSTTDAVNKEGKQLKIKIN
jgi:hypothetical protein